MSREEIAEKLREIIIFALPNKKDTLNKCTEESNLRTDIGLNSVGLLYIVIAIEEVFQISFENMSFDSFKTVKDVLDYIEKESEKNEVDSKRA